MWDGIFFLVKLRVSHHAGKIRFIVIFTFCEIKNKHTNNFIFVITILFIFITYVNFKIMHQSKELL